MVKPGPQCQVLSIPQLRSMISRFLSSPFKLQLTTTISTAHITHQVSVGLPKAGLTCADTQCYQLSHGACVSPPNRLWLPADLLRHPQHRTLPRMFPRPHTSTTCRMNRCYCSYRSKVLLLTAERFGPSCQNAGC